MTWNPRYLAYATAHGLSPQQILDRDRAEYSGAGMTGFVVWLSQQGRAGNALGQPLTPHCVSVLVPG